FTRATPFIKPFLIHISTIAMGIFAVSAYSIGITNSPFVFIKPHSSLWLAYFLLLTGASPLSENLSASLYIKGTISSPFSFIKPHFDDDFAAGARPLLKFQANL